MEKLKKEWPHLAVLGASFLMLPALSGLAGGGTALVVLFACCVSFGKPAVRLFCGQSGRLCVVVLFRGRCAVYLVHPHVLQHPKHVLLWGHICPAGPGGKRLWRLHCQRHGHARYQLEAQAGTEKSLTAAEKAALTACLKKLSAAFSVRGTGRFVPKRALPGKRGLCRAFPWGAAKQEKPKGLHQMNCPIMCGQHKKEPW